MARLPQASDLQRTRAPSETPDVKVQKIDYSPFEAGGRAIASGLNKFGAGVGAAARASATAGNEQEEYETKKKLIDFQLKVDQEYDAYRQTMPEGAPGFAAGWQERYKGLAKGFVGRDDSNIPATQRGKVGLHLKQFEARSTGAAYKTEVDERDRVEIKGLETTLGALRDKVGKQPDSRDEHYAAGQDLIRSSRLSPAVKDATLKKFETEFAREHILGRMRRSVDGKDLGSFRGIKADIAGQAPPHKRGAGAAAGSARAAEEEGIEVEPPRPGASGATPPPTYKIIENNVPTPSQRRDIFAKGGVVVNLDTNWAPSGRSTTPMIVIPDNATPAQRKAAQAYVEAIAGVYRDQFGKDITPKVVTRSQNGRGRPATIHTEPYAVTDGVAVKYFSSPQGAKVHAKILRDTLGTIPGVQFSIPHDPGRGDHGAGHNGVDEVKLARLVLAELKQGGGAPKDDYKGPYAALSARERYQLWHQVNAAEKRVLEGSRHEIKQALSADLQLLRNTGKGLPDLDLDRARKVLEPNQVNRYLIQREAAGYAFDLRDGLHMLSPEKIAKRFADAKPPEDHRYGDYKKEYDNALKYAREQIDLRRKDPAHAAQEYSGVKEAIDDYRKNPNGNRFDQSMRIMSERMLAQALMGIPEGARSPITVADARALMAPLIGIKGDEIGPILQKMVPEIIQRYGEYADDVLRFIARTQYRDRASQEVMQGVITNIERKGLIEKWQSDRMTQIDEANRREAQVTGAAPAGGAGRFAPRQSVAPSYPEAALSYLRSHKELSEAFEKKYGLKPGTAAQLIK
ncbi:MAG TPA: hypothetical protein VMX97_10705, partial [Hyphomicrobiaceae bacterium]|nr:hypothetical protein [Hyphomicrobiaceae bacterium]